MLFTKVCGQPLLEISFDLPFYIERFSHLKYIFLGQNSKAGLSNNLSMKSCFIKEIDLRKNLNKGESEL